MKDVPRARVSGSVRDIFAHRFVLRTEEGPVLADLGPKGLAKITLRIGDEVEIEGEQMPSEIKVSGIVRGRESVNLSDHGKREHDKKHKHHDHDDALLAPDIATRVINEAGLITVGQPRHKRRHFEILGRDSDGNLIELHVDQDGVVKKRKTVDEADKGLEDIKDEP